MSIQTNSAAILRAVTDVGLVSIRHAKQQVDLHWELVVEEESGVSTGVAALLVLRDEQTIMIETGQRDWFAFDFATGEGAGFVETGKSEESVQTYLRAVVEVIGPELRKLRKETADDE